MLDDALRMISDMELSGTIEDSQAERCRERVRRIRSILECVDRLPVSLVRSEATKHIHETDVMINVMLGHYRLTSVVSLRRPEDSWYAWGPDRFSTSTGSLDWNGERFESDVREWAAASIRVFV